MVRFLKAIAIAAIAGVVCAGVIFACALEGWWRTPLAPRGDTHAFLSAAIARIDAESHGNAAFVLIEGGKPVGEHFVSKRGLNCFDSPEELARLFAKRFA